MSPTVCLGLAPSAGWLYPWAYKPRPLRPERGYRASSVVIRCCLVPPTAAALLARAVGCLALTTLSLASRCSAWPRKETAAWHQLVSRTATACWSRSLHLAHDAGQHLSSVGESSGAPIEAVRTEHLSRVGESPSCPGVDPALGRRHRTNDLLKLSHRLSRNRSSLLELLCDQLQPLQRRGRQFGQCLHQGRYIGNFQPVEHRVVHPLVLNLPLLQQLRRVQPRIPVNLLMMTKAEQDQVRERVTLLGRQVAAVSGGAGPHAMDMSDLSILLVDARPNLKHDRHGTTGCVALAIADGPEGGHGCRREILAYASAVGARLGSSRHAHSVTGGYDRELLRLSPRGYARPEMESRLTSPSGL
ncbi:hypothetical protein ONO86_05633 [Micromonospora noduli]|nr:hypothetical protein ONO86_05633 [Micromonospora noduli]